MSPLEEAVSTSKRLTCTTRRQYLGVVRHFLAFAGPNPTSWTPAVVDSWMQQLTVEPISINAYIAALKFASRRWAALHDRRDFAAAAENVLVPATKHSRSPIPLNEDQLRDLFATCDGGDPVDLRDRAIIAIGLHAGFRRAEIARIEFDDLDHGERSIVVIAKRNKRHRVRVGAACWDRIDAWLEWLRRRHVGSGRVFRSLRRCLDAELGYCVGASMTPGAIYGVIRGRARRAGIDGVCSHTLRHSCVALLRGRGVPEHEIARRVGHASVETTALYGGDLVRDQVADWLPA